MNVGVALGLFAVRVRAGIDATRASSITADVAQTAPLPMVGLDVEWYPSDRFTVKAVGQYLSISLDDKFDGSWGELRIGGEWHATRNFGLGAMYNLADIDLAIRLEDADVSEFDYRYKFDGPVLYVFAIF